jgi:hypothetical protein
LALATTKLTVSHAQLLLAIPMVGLGAHSLLMIQLKQCHAKEWALCWLTTIGQACRAVAAETLRTTLQWAIDQVTQKNKKPQQLMVQLGLI